MKRKFLFATISTLTFLGIFFQSGTSVSAVTDYGNYVWSFEDLLNGTGEAWSRPECTEGDPFSGNPCMEASMQFYAPSSAPVYITSIDPATSKIRIFFKTESRDFLKFYLFWSDRPWTLFDIIDDNNYSNAHNLFYEESSDLNSGLLQPWREIELTVSNGRLLSQAPYEIYYVFDDYDQPASVGDVPPQGGVAAYASCMADYHIGMECRLRFDDYGNQLYVAVDPNAIAAQTEDPTTVDGPTTIDGSTMTDDPSSDDPSNSGTNFNESDIRPESGVDPAATETTNSDENNHEPGSTTDNQSNNEIDTTTDTGSYEDGRGMVVVNEPANLTSATTTVSSGTNSKVTFTTPDTGANTPAKDNVTEFPWWLGIILASGILTLAWLFWPTRRQKSKKI